MVQIIFYHAISYQVRYQPRLGLLFGIRHSSRGLEGLLDETFHLLSKDSPDLVIVTFKGIFSCEDEQKVRARFDSYATQSRVSLRYDSACQDCSSRQEPPKTI